MKTQFLIIFIFIYLLGYSQEIEVSEKDNAKLQIIQLKKEGALIVRLNLSKRNIGLYRKAGNIKLANKLQTKLDSENKLIALAFLDSTFNFCPVYIIEAKNYGRVLNGEKNGYFLDKNLKVDSNITINENFYFFIDRGVVYEQVGNSFKTSETSSTPKIHDAFVMKDKDLNQLIKPLPFYSRILSHSSLHTNVGYFSKTEKKWYKSIVYYKTEYYSNQDSSIFNYNYKNIIRRENNFTKKELQKNSKNISEYYKITYGLEKSELTLPFTIYRLNTKLTNYFLDQFENDEFDNLTRYPFSFQPFHYLHRTANLQYNFKH